MWVLNHVARRWQRAAHIGANDGQARQNPTVLRRNAARGAEMKHPTNRVLHAYWDKLRDGRMAPERNDIDPAAIKNALLDTFILEVDPGMELPLRVAGARIAALFARELKGESFPLLFDEADRRGIRDIVRDVLDDSRPAVAGATIMAPGQRELDFELLLLPLRHHGKTHSRLLGALAPATVPNWMGLVEPSLLRLTSWRIIATDTTPAIETAARTTSPQAANVNQSATPRFQVFKGGRAK